MTMQKKTFSAIIKSIQKQMDKDCAFIAALNAFIDGHPVLKLNHELYESLIESLEHDFIHDGQADAKIIESWFYDLAEPWIKMNDIIYTVETPEQLYDFLKEYYV